jgi:hypothetical protein
LVVACLLLCAACAGPVSELPPLPADEVAAEQRRQQIAQMHDYYAQLARVDNVAFHIAAANSEFCTTVSPQIGIAAAMQARRLISVGANRRRLRSPAAHRRRWPASSPVTKY